MDLYNGSFVLNQSYVFVFTNIYYMYGKKCYRRNSYFENPLFAPIFFTHFHRLVIGKYIAIIVICVIVDAFKGLGTVASRHQSMLSISNQYHSCTNCKAIFITLRPIDNIYILIGEAKTLDPFSQKLRGRWWKFGKLIVYM